MAPLLIAAIMLLVVVAALYALWHCEDFLSL